MKQIILIGLILMSIGLSSPLPNASLYRFIPTQVGLEINWHGLTMDNWEKANLTTDICGIAAWGGTAIVFGTIPWWNKPWARTTVKIAASVAVAGIFGEMIFGGDAR